MTPTSLTDQATALTAALDSLAADVITATNEMHRLAEALERARDVIRNTMPSARDASTENELQQLVREIARRLRMRDALTQEAPHVPPV